MYLQKFCAAFSLRKAAFVLVGLPLLSVLVVAQSTFGSFVGTVHDPSGGLVPETVITLVNAGTSARRTTITDKDGNYVLVNIEPGMYQITMQAPGFQPANYSNLQLLARQTVRIDGTLSIAAQAESVSVTATNEAVIATEVSNIAHTQTGRELFDLPVALGSRANGSTSAISTLSTQAGVQVDNNGSISVAGSKPSMLSISVDGISTMSVRTNSPAAELFPSFGAIAEIRVSEINNSAEYGGVSDITTVSKSGSNAFHGGVFENLQNTALNARNPFSAAKTKTIMNNFGAFAGGPLIIPKLYNGKDKTFFFASYEGLKLPRQTFISQSVPSLALREGDLSVYTRVLDPTTGVNFPGNRIPLTRISPIALNALQHLYPLPNTGVVNSITNNYTTNLGTPISSNQGDLRVDQNVSARQTIFVRGTYKFREVQDAPNANGTILAGTSSKPERNYAVTFAHNFVITPTVVNEVRAGLSDVRIITSSLLSAQEIIAKIGVPVPDPPQGSASPTFSIAGFQGTGSTASSVSRTKTLQLLDNLTWTKGKSTLKFGADIRKMSAYFSNVFSAPRAGQYTFNNSITSSLIGNPYGAFLLGIPDRTGLGLVNSPDSNGQGTHYAFYAQDDWKVTPRLTVNFGLRWEYHPPFRDALNNIAVFLPDAVSVAPDGSQVRGAVAVPDDGYSLTHPLFAASIAPTPIYTATQAGIPQELHRNQKSSFAPRIGFAWRPFADGKTVIRGGYGRYIEAMLGTLTSAGWAVSASNVGAYTNTIVNGQPTLKMPYPFPESLARPGTQDFRLSADVNYRDPYVHQWNFTFERDLGFSTGVRLSYDGSHGTNIGYIKNLGQLPANTVGYSIARAASPFPLMARISHESTGARSNYNAFTVAVNKRMSRGLMFQSNYSFAKNLSNGQGYNPTNFASQAGGTVTDPYNLDLDYGNVVFTRRHRFLTTFLYELPIGRKGMILTKANRALDMVIGGWQLSGVALFQTGAFLTVVAPGADPAGNNFPNLEGAGRADSVLGVSPVPQDQNIRRWINPAAYSIPLNNIGRAGTSPVGSANGPGTQAVSLSLFKTFAITEAVRLQIGAAASNAFNHPNYTNPNLNLGTAPFGTINNVQTQESGGPRSMQITGRISF